MTTVIVKATFEGATRRFPIDSSAITFSDLHSKLLERFTTADPLVVMYKDSDNDLITVDSDIDLGELIASAEAASGPARVFLYTPDEAKEIADAARSAPIISAPQSKNSDVRIPHLEALVAGVAELLSVIKKNSVSGIGSAVLPPDAAPTTGTRGMGGPTASPKAASAAKGQRQGLFAGIRPYMSAFPSGKPALKKHLVSISPEAKLSFKKLVRFIKKSDNTGEIVHALKETFPVFRKWMISDLGDEGMPEPEKVDAIVAALKLSLEVEVGEQITKRVTDFVRIALADEGIITILRKARNIGPMPWEAGFSLSGRGKQGPRGFNVHHKISCGSCGMKPIVGSRFKCTNRKNFNLCSNCHGNDNVAKDGMKFIECQYVWENVLVDVKVPPAPLKAGDRGAKVKFLHKILTDLGYMNEGMYGKHPGIYSATTQAAVEQFQREHNLGSACDEGVYDEATAERLGNVVENHDMEVVDSAAIAETTTMQD